MLLLKNPLQAAVTAKFSVVSNLPTHKQPWFDMLTMTLQLQTLVCYIEKLWIKHGFTLLNRWVKKHIFRIFGELPAKVIES